VSFSVEVSLSESPFASAGELEDVVSAALTSYESNW